MLPNTRRLISNFDRKNAIGKRKTFITQDHPIKVDPNPKKHFVCLHNNRQISFTDVLKVFCGFGTNKDKYIGKTILKTQDRQIFLLPKTI